MAQIKYTKNELLDLQKKLTQYSRYLPTLQLKKALLQAEVNKAADELKKRKKKYIAKHKEVEEFAPLLSDRAISDLPTKTKVSERKLQHENIAGVDIPSLEGVIFHRGDMPLWFQPPWIDDLIDYIRDLVIQKEKVEIVKMKLATLQEELRTVSIRVNLFEKRLIPRTEESIQKIKVFLGDQDLAAVALAKVAKGKIQKKKEAKA